MDKFFEVKNCQRCGSDLSVRIMSWFSDATICMACSKKEDEVKAQLSDKGKSLEGCGYVPEIVKGNK